jgi:hypothetical protein
MSAQAKPWKPTSRQVAYFLRFSENSKYYIQNMEQLRKDYGGKFIAILKGEIVLEEDDAQKLLDLLREKYTGEERSQIFTTYVPLEQEIRIA